MCIIINELRVFFGKSIKRVCKLCYFLQVRQCRNNQWIAIVDDRSIDNGATIAIVANDNRHLHCRSTMDAIVDITVALFNGGKLLKIFI